MKTTSASDVGQHPHFDHLLKVGVLLRLAGRKATRAEATAELLRYRDEGLIAQNNKENNMATPKGVGKKEKALYMSGFCASPSTIDGQDSHLLCKAQHGCVCPCHEEEKVFSGQGIIFAVIDDREELRTGRVTTIDVITEAIEAALDAGHETSEEIARYLTTSAFQHQRDRRVRFNSVLKASDIVGARISQKLHNAYNELATTADEEDDATDKALLQAEASGFAAAISIVFSPFSTEDSKDSRLVNWDEVDRITAAFEKEQQFVIKEREGNPQ